MSLEGASRRIVAEPVAARAVPEPGARPAPDVPGPAPPAAPAPQCADGAWTPPR